MRIRQFVITALTGAAFVWCALASSVMPAQAQGKSASDLYLDKCSVCHGADGAGATAKGKKLKVKNVRETSQKLSAAEMIEIVKNGKAPDMDAFAKELTPEQITAIVDHYRGLAKK